MSSHQPGPSTCSGQDTRSRHSRHTTSQFPFSQLPTELRLDILEVYALPKQPIFYVEHAFCGPEPLNTLGLFRRAMREFWCLRQVNREARRVVLRGRQAVRSRLESVFVDWEHNVFVTIPTDYPPTLKYPQDFYRNIQWLGLFLWRTSFNVYYYKDEMRRFRNVIAELPALRGLYLVVYWETLRSYEQDILAPSVYAPAWNYERLPPQELDILAPAVHAPIPVKTILPLVRHHPESRVRTRHEFLQHLNRIKDEMQDFASTTSGRTIDCKLVVECLVEVPGDISGMFVRGTAILKA